MPRRAALLLVCLLALATGIALLGIAAALVPPRIVSVSWRSDGESGTVHRTVAAKSDVVTDRRPIIVVIIKVAMAAPAMPTPAPAAPPIPPGCTDHAAYPWIVASCHSSR